MFNLRNLFLAAAFRLHYGRSKGVRSGSSPGNKYRPHQGARERTRRANQIQRGMLRTN